MSRADAVYAIAIGATTAPSLAIVGAVRAVRQVAVAFGR
jgi:Na+/H+ antiporter NhaD/arsenite permease-like protein